MYETNEARRITAALTFPGYHGSGEPDVAARVAEYGQEFESWPCDEWDWAREVLVPTVDGRMIDIAGHR